jgi:hypothetical protein
MGAVKDARAELTGCRTPVGASHTLDKSRRWIVQRYFGQFNTASQDNVGTTSHSDQLSRSTSRGTIGQQDSRSSAH